MIHDDRVGEEAVRPQEENVKEDDDTYAKTTVGSVDELEDKEQKVMEEVWNRVEDSIIYKFDALIELSENLELTKRNLLRLLQVSLILFSC